MPERNYALVMAKRFRDSTLPQIGRHLRMLRTALGVSQVDWADTMQITPQLLSKWEHGKRLPNIEVLIRICDSTRCTLDFIFRGRVGRDVDPELRQRLASLYGGEASVWLVSPEEQPPPPDPSAAAASPSRKPHKTPARLRQKSPDRASTRKKPPAPRHPSKP